MICVIAEDVTCVLGDEPRLPASSVRARNDAPLNSNRWISLFIWSLLVFDGFDAGDEEVDAGGAFFPPVGVEVFDVHGFAFLVGEV